MRPAVLLLSLAALAFVATAEPQHQGRPGLRRKVKVVRRRKQNVGQQQPQSFGQTPLQTLIDIAGDDRGNGSLMLLGAGGVRVRL